LARKLIQQHAEWGNFDETAISEMLGEVAIPAAKK
jgi:hypothetical protein